MFNNQIIAGSSGQGGSFYSTTIDQSLRLDGTSAYLTKSDFGTATDTAKRTFSTWIKTSRDVVPASYNHIIGAGSSGIDGFGFDTTEKLQWIQGGAVTFSGNRLIRDTSAWYHIFTTWNSTDNELYIYVNGELDYSSTSSLSALSKLGNTGHTTYIGRRSNVATYIHGYLAETVFLDGTIGDVNDFGETVNGVWVPKDISAAGLTYGTNGFYLDYADSSDLGKDVSGQGNHFTSNNLAAIDQVPDSPTNNFATWNTLDKYNYNAPSEGNLRALTAGNNGTQPATFAVSSGKWYFEVRNGTAGSASLARFVGIGAEDTNITTTPYNNADNYLYYSTNGNTYSGGTSVAYGDSWQTAGDIIGVALDMDNGAIYFSKNGVWQNSATAAEIAAGTTTNAAFTGLSGTFVPLVAKTGGTSSNDPHDANFGQNPSFNGNLTGGDVGTEADDSGYGLFKYPVPSGFNCLATANLPEPAIGPNSTTTSDEHFNTVLYTGNSSNDVTASNTFASDFVWLKKRSGADNHYLQDIVRGFGASKSLSSNTTGTEGYNGGSPATQDITTTSSSIQFQGADFATNSATYASWNWKAGGTAVSNTDGSTTSNVSANTDAGFSIITWLADAATGTVGHGLSSAPELVIAKPRDDSGTNWYVMHTGALTASQVLNLDGTTAAFTPGVAHFNSTYPTSSVISYGGYLGNALTNNNKLAYCFHSVEGFSKVGKYFTNNSSDGTFVYTGFRPKFVMIKRTDGAVDWQILDAERVTYNPNDKRLEPNTTASEATTSSTSDFYADFLSNGFKLRGNGSAANGGTSATVIYLAFAEAPFKYANAR